MLFRLCPNYCIPLSRCPPGGGSVRAAGFGDVSVEPAGPSSSLHVLLAPAVRSADLLLLQHQRPAYLKGAASVPLSYQVGPQRRSHCVGASHIEHHTVFTVCFVCQQVMVEFFTLPLLLLLLLSVLQNAAVRRTPCWVWCSPSPSSPWEFSHSASSICKVTEPL